ncbi:hypothetical protein PF008_g15630 [Phytophthora fragariae]|uniref:Uncharacterized protein n=1 Tax=Phytophthora fragariae TaxID=53985 RepID=A0A6G0RDK0_9STRA|nr:hypothetical protein PF008_g15630 [Phytophthora fragariae]
MEDFWILVCASWRCRDGELKSLREEFNEMLLDEEWRRVMRTRHALTAECLTSPSVSACMCMYTNGTDANFLNVTSLMRYAFETLRVQFKPFFRIPSPSQLQSTGAVKC